MKCGKTCIANGIFIGHVEEQAMDDYTFAMQQRTFDVHGYAINPSNLSSINGTNAPLVGSLNSAHSNNYLSIQDIRPSNAVRKETKRKRDGKGDAGVVEGEGAYLGPWAGWEDDKDVEVVVEEEAEEWREEKRKREEARVQAQEKMKEARVEKSIFHGKSGLTASRRWRVALSPCCRQGIDGLCGKDVHAHTDGQGC
jgi:pre-mRNA-processing factor 17